MSPATVGTSTDANAVGYSSQRKSFYAAGRFWVFYSDGTNAYYKSTTDPDDWSGSPTSIGACEYGHAVSIYFDGVYIHYVRYYNYDLFYRRGEPQSDGSISWSADEQLVHNGESSYYYYYPCISVDSGGFAWIGARYLTGGLYYPYVRKNANNDGTWSTDFSTKLNDTSSSYWKVFVAPLTSGKVYVIYCYSGARPRGKLYDSGWGSEENDLADYNIETGYKFSAGAEGDNVHFTYNRANTYQIRYNKRASGVGWGDPDVLVEGSLESHSSPSLSIDGSILYCFWTRTAYDHVYYKKYSSGSWDADPTDWIDETTDDIKYGYMHSCYYESYDKKIGLLYITKTASPYNVKFAYLSLMPFPTVTTQDATGIGKGIPP